MLYKTYQDDQFNDFFKVEKKTKEDVKYYESDNSYNKIQSDTNNLSFVAPNKIREEEYYFYEKVLKQSKIDLNSNNYILYFNVVGWIFVEDEDDEGSFNYTLEALYLINYKISIVKWSASIAIKTAKRYGFDFEATKRDFYKKYGRYLGSF